MKLSFIAALLGTFLIFSAAGADEDAEAALDLVRAGKIAPLAQLLSTIDRLYGGQVLEVELEHENGKVRTPAPVYEVKVMTPEGRLLKVYLDARSLDVLKVKGRRKDE